MEKDKKIHILLLPSWYIPEGGKFCRNKVQILTERGLKSNVLANVSLSWKKYKFRDLHFLGISIQVMKMD